MISTPFASLPKCQGVSEKNYWDFIPKLDGVGPVDNRPSTDKLHHFVPPPKKNLTHDM